MSDGNLFSDDNLFGERLFLHRSAVPDDRDIRLRLIPVQVPLHPNIGVADEQYRKKNCHLNEGVAPQPAVDYSPRDKKYDFDIEDQEDECDDVEADIEPDPGVADRFLAAFIRAKLCRIPAVRTHQPRRDEAPGNEYRPENEEEEYAAEVCDH